MKLFAISDLHVNHTGNRELLDALEEHPDDWLIVAGDVGEREADLRYTFEALQRRFARVVWVPGNHELWSISGPDPVDRLRGEDRYNALIELARCHGVVTPEDPYLTWPGDVSQAPRAPGDSARRLVIAPLFLLYDYTFRPPEISEEGAVIWAMQDGIVCADERFLYPHPFGSRQEWCASRCEQAEARLSALGDDTDTILINHFPLMREHARLPNIPRFSIWCGTERTRQWHRRFHALVVVTGHLHIRSTRWLDGVRFEEVSLGYPRQRAADRTLESYLRPILPLSEPPSAAASTGSSAG